jgi:hypothetical protein
MVEIDARVKNGLRELVERAPMDADVWPATSTHVARHRRRRMTVAAGGLAVVVAAVVVVGVVRSTSPKHRVRVAAVPHRLPEGTALLAARGSEIEALDAQGHDLGTIYTLKRAQTAVEIHLAADHKSLWYVSGDVCSYQNNEPVVRVDLATGTEKVVTGAVAIAVSPDGTRLALSRRAKCNGDGPATERLYVRELATGAETELVPQPNLRAGFWSAGQISWSPNGDRVAALLRDENDRSRAFVFAVPPRGQPSPGHEFTSGAHQPPTGLAWTHDGLFVSRRDATPGTTSNIYYVERDHVRQVTTTAVVITGVEVADGRIFVMSGAAGTPENLMFSVQANGSLMQLATTAEAFTAA